MAAIILAALQILLLLLRAHFSKNDDQEKTLAHLRSAQATLDAVANQFETQMRYEAPKQDRVDKVQDKLDEDKRT